MEIKELAKTLEEIKKIREDGSEFWSARELSPLLGYRQWRGFLGAIARAKHSCQKNKNDVKVHFAHLRKPQNSRNQYGKTVGQEVEDYELTRYAAYLIAQNGDSKKSKLFTKPFNLSFLIFHF